MIATFAAAIVAACITHKLGKRQNELQEQQIVIQKRQNELQEQQNQIQEVQTRLMAHQTKIQEHDQYKELYLLIRAIHHKLDTTISDIAQTLYWFPDEDFCNETFNKKLDEISELTQNFSKFKIELYLKTDINDAQYSNYYIVLRRITFLYYAIMGNVQFAEVATSGVESKASDSDEKCIEHILQYAQYSARDSISKALNDFINAKDKISEYNVLQSLEKHCKF